LARVGGVEDTIFMAFAGETVKAEPEGDIERTSEEGKASSVHFIHFRFTPAAIAKFRAPDTQVVIGFKHPNYGHMAALQQAARAELAKDFD
ncbi:MAG: DUF3501 family protein, partial [Rhodospirillales bacterium]